MDPIGRAAERVLPVAAQVARAARSRRAPGVVGHRLRVARLPDPADPGLPIGYAPAGLPLVSPRRRLNDVID